MPYGETKVYHGGLNPNFSSFVGFLPNKKLGIAILTNSNSSYTAYLGNVIMKILNNEEIAEISEPENSTDKVFSLISFILMAFIVGVFILFTWVIKGIITGERKVEAIGLKSVLKMFGGLLLTIPFIYGIYLLPKALMDFSWDAAIVWAPNGCTGTLTRIRNLPFFPLIMFVILQSWLKTVN